MTGSRLSESPRASIKVRAALSGGLVFGLAAGLTVASWTDAERVGATFTASSFDLQTSVQAGAYTTVTPVTPVPVPVTGLYPGLLGYVSLRVKTVAGSTAGTVTFTATANSTGLAAVLRYRIVRTALACTAAVFDGSQPFVVGSSAPAYQQVNANLVGSVGSPVVANAGTEVGFCIELGMPLGTAVSNAGTSGTLTLNIVGTSS